MDRPVLRGVNLRGAKLADAKITNADIHNAIYDDEAAELIASAECSH